MFSKVFAHFEIYMLLKKNKIDGGEVSNWLCIMVNFDAGTVFFCCCCTSYCE